MEAGLAGLFRHLAKRLWEGRPFGKASGISFGHAASKN
ncbi:hypothetical protein CSB93_3314 [Pseudomonas paraeruginosa]|uniref:Uncharacterized protein n=1 Tax=Pseudomonas paraeruginosa TaxID=2994495 RepID=A0A2R3IZA8_9PSED|nr:hypothetical protein CSB93_3314 [Pseudomonas paraeruginosa]AWE93735.1 hypothetical protein CSC28_2091 [Pseudomonas paraeruginosa]